MGKLETFKKNGVVVIRGAFTIDGLSELHHNINQYKNEALKLVDGDGEPRFDQKKLVFSRQQLAADLSTIDPETKDYVQGQVNWENFFLDTSLVKTIKSGKGWPEIASIISGNIYFMSGRVRAVHHKIGTPNDVKGAVYFHQEKHVIKTRDWSHGYNLWMFLTPYHEVANLTTPGIQFALGERGFWREDHSTDFEDSALPRIKALNQHAQNTVDCQEEFVDAGDYVLYRPHLHVGDIVIFDAHVPHASFVPGSATKSRVSCEFRVHPK